MLCHRFLEEYSDFRDGRLPPARAAELGRHLVECPCCARYDRVMRRGADLLCDLPSAEASEDFLPRLQHRIYNVEQGLESRSAGRFGGSAALVGVAAVGLLAFFWLPFAARVPLEMELSPVAVESPPPVTADAPSLFGSGPFVNAANRDLGSSLLEDGGKVWQLRPARRHQALLLDVAADLSPASAPGR